MGGGAGAAVTLLILAASTEPLAPVATGVAGFTATGVDDATTGVAETGVVGATASGSGVGGVGGLTIYVRVWTLLSLLSHINTSRTIITDNAMSPSED